MKIATFNVNNVNKRLGNLIDWLKATRPDVACLQELKATDSDFPVAAIEKVGYGAVWRGQKSWNGVAILARDCARKVFLQLIEMVALRLPNASSPAPVYSILHI